MSKIKFILNKFENYIGFQILKLDESLHNKVFKGIILGNINLDYKCINSFKNSTSIKIWERGGNINASIIIYKQKNVDITIPSMFINNSKLNRYNILLNCLEWLSKNSDQLSEIPITRGYTRNNWSMERYFTMWDTENNDDFGL